MDAVAKTLPLFEGIEPAPENTTVAKKKAKRKARKILVETALAWAEQRGKSFVDVWIAAHNLSEIMK